MKAKIVDDFPFQKSGGYSGKAFAGFYQPSTIKERSS